MSFKRTLQLLFAVGAMGATANASVAVFNFDTDALGTSTTFTDTVNGLSATFSSNADPGGFTILGSMFETLTGNVLGDPGPAGQDNLSLFVNFSSELTAVEFNFATSDFATPSPLTLNAYQNSVLVGSTSATGMFLGGFVFPEGEIAFDGPAFNRIVISSTATDFAVDNITAATAAAPEPGTLSLFALSILFVAGVAWRTELRRRAVSSN
jgi:PEP-CTERM motif